MNLRLFVSIFLLIIILFTKLQLVQASGESVLFFDDFSDGSLSDWVIEGGNWSVDNGNLLGFETGRAHAGRIDSGSGEWDNYRLDVDVNNNLGVDEGVGFRYTPGGSSYELNLRHGTGAFGTPELVLRKNLNGVVSTIGDTHSVSLVNNKWYQVRVEVINENIKIWVNNSLVFSITDSGTKIKKGTITLSYWTGDVAVAKVRFDNVKVTTLNPPPDPFLELPWDYQAKGLSFSDAANSINSFFDHEYPLLSSGLSEPLEMNNSIIFYRDGGRSFNMDYSSHDGYDYGLPAKVNLEDPVLAAASGWATYMNSCGACGNAILIDHGNGYQTRYYHLLKDGLVTNVSGNKVWVNSGQVIGKVGSTGRSTGAHIHFMVIQDKNKDGNFEDNIPDGITDPFGWQSDKLDPWPLYSYNYTGKRRTGNISYYLWKNKIDDLSQNLSSNGGVFKLGKYTLDFPEDATDQSLNLEIKSSPTSKLSKTVKSIGTNIVATVKDTTGKIISKFKKLFTIKLDFSGINLSKYKKETISFYSSEDGVNWTKENTNLDLANNSAATQVDHMSYFALMAERIDTSPPTTIPVFKGQMGKQNWFRSDVQLSFEALDSGLGVDYTLYKLEGGDWEIYKDPLSFSKAGHFKVKFYSADNDENLEDVKSIEFDIDKSAPEARIFIDQNSKDLVLEGIDNKETEVQKTNSKKANEANYLISDLAGNSLKLEVKDLDKSNLDLLKIYSLDYNDNPIIKLADNSLTVNYIVNPKDPKKTIIQTQQLQINNKTNIVIKYDALKNQSLIIDKNSKTYKSGMVLLQLSTNQGNLEYRY